MAIIKQTNSELNLTSTNSNVKLITQSEGFDFEVQRFNINGRVKVGSSTKIGTLTMTAHPGSNPTYNTEGKLNATSSTEMRYNKVPQLLASKLNSRSLNNITLVRKGTEKDTKNNNVGYTFDIMYEAKEGLFNGDLSFSILERVSSKLTERTGFTGLQNVEAGDQFVPLSGEVRKITLTGSPKSTAKIIITKLNDIKDSAGNIIDSSEISILSKTVTQTEQSGLDRTGVPINVGTITMDDNGKASFYQNFKQEGTETRYKIRVLASELMTSFNTSNWVRPTDGSFTDYYERALLMTKNPIITFKTITTWSNVTVDALGSGSFVAFSNIAPIIFPYKGSYNKFSNKITSKSIMKKRTFKFIFKASSGSFTLGTGSDGAGGTRGNPLYSRIRGLESDWTNSFPNDDTENGLTGNGGSIVDIKGISSTISTTSSSNDTITVIFTVEIIKWGTENVTMELDTDKIAALA